MIFLSFNYLPYSPVILEDTSLDILHDTAERVTKLSRKYYYLEHQGLPVFEDGIVLSGEFNLVPRLLGGKGGFGSMLRAIGAQIEKTTNREACRDLSGRRLRDINEEQRLKTWISQQSEREKEMEDRKRKKLQKLSAEPKHEFKDEHYDIARSELTEKLYESVEQGLAQTSHSSGVKRPSENTKRPKKKVKKFLKCDEEDLLSSSDESTDETSTTKPLRSEDISEDNPTDEIPKSDALITSGM